MHGVNILDERSVVARKVLLDALEILGPHRRALVLVGAQAIHLHIGDGDMAVAPFTLDGDLAVDPRALASRPNLPKIMTAGGFVLTVRPGTWTLRGTEVHIDLLVPATLGGSGRRAARLGIHGSDAARKAVGLEATLVDNTLKRVMALNPRDHRGFDIRVAGPAALLVAKLHKIDERKDVPERLQSKDGLDVLRILRFAPPGSLAIALQTLATHDISSETTQTARKFLEELFAARDGIGSQMAVRASAGLEDADTIALSCEALARRVLKAWPALPLQGV